MHHNSTRFCHEEGHGTAEKDVGRDRARGSHDPSSTHPLGCDSVRSTRRARHTDEAILGQPIISFRETAAQNFNSICSDLLGEVVRGLDESAPLVLYGGTCRSCLLSATSGGGGGGAARGCLEHGGSIDVVHPAAG